MRTPGHYCIPVFSCKAREIVFNCCQFTLDDIAYMLQHQRCPGLGSILHGCGILEPLPAVASDAPLERPNQADGSRIGGLNAGPHLLMKVSLKFYRTTC